ncbi:MAG: two pore domain potassium channel family protein [Rhodobacterales bacterium]|nr:two pore domain potassium channel family protein [Rhodobacterales bacterium]
MVLFLNLAVATLMVAITFAIHFAGLVGLTALLRQRSREFQRRTVKLGGTLGQGLGILIVVFSLFALHSLEIWLYAFAYLLVGELHQIETAVYFSTSTFTTVGFGDVILSHKWRMLGVAESMNGFLLISWSTAFLVSLTARVRAFEAKIEGLDD